MPRAELAGGEEGAEEAEADREVDPAAVAERRSGRAERRGASKRQGRQTAASIVAARGCPTAPAEPLGRRHGLVALPASAVLAAALPLLFLHVDYQPGFTVTSARPRRTSSSPTSPCSPSRSRRRRGRPPGSAASGRLADLGPGRALLLMVGASSVYPRLWDGDYASRRTPSRRPSSPSTGCSRSPCRSCSARRVTSS